MKNGLLLLSTLTLLACAGVDTRRPRYTRTDDATTLRLRHLRLWTNGGYPLWLEVRLPRTAGTMGSSAELVFTTTISHEPRFHGCDSAMLGAAPNGVSADEVRYAKTNMRLEAELGTTGNHYVEKGVVEDVYVSVPTADLSRFVAGSELAGRVCERQIRFETWQLQQIGRLLRDGQRPSVSASARASSMLSSMEQ